MRDSRIARDRSVISQSDVKAFVTGLLTELSTLCRDVLQIELEDLQPESWKVGSERPTECTICGQLLAHRGEDWWDRCPTCADRVSAYMDEHNLDGKTGRAEAIRRVRKTMARVFEQYRRAPAKTKWMLVIETQHPAEYSGPRITFHDSRAGALAEAAEWLANEHPSAQGSAQTDDIEAALNESLKQNLIRGWNLEEVFV